MLPLAIGNFIDVRSCSAAIRLLFGSSSVGSVQFEIKYGVLMKSGVERSFQNCCEFEKNAKSCPISVQYLRKETLAEPSRILTDYLDGLMISCDHSESGCTEVVQFSKLKTHVRECNYRPVVCTNEKCGQTFKQEDLADHMTNACEYRLVHCPDCEDDMIYKKFSKHACVLSMEWSEVKNVLTEMCYSQKEICDLQKEILTSIESLAVDKQIMEKSQTPLVPKVSAHIVAIGGRNNEGNLSSVEVLYPGSTVWTVLHPMQESRGSASSVLYGNDVIVCGGRSNEDVHDTIERLPLLNKPLTWVPFPVKLPLKCCGHKVVVINNCLYLVGGHAGKTPFKTIYSILLHPPYTVELKCEMQQAVCFHGLQPFGDSLFIFGGSPTGTLEKAVNTVVSYNTVSNEVSVMKPLPFAICDVATVRWKNNVIIIGGTANNSISLNTAILYNVKGNTLKMLPSMKHARSSCAVTVAGNKVIVMGGYDWGTKKYLNSVECFDLDRQLWEELPTMYKARSEATAVVYAGSF